MGTRHHTVHMCYDVSGFVPRRFITSMDAYAHRTNICKMWGLNETCMGNGMGFKLFGVSRKPCTAPDRLSMVRIRKPLRAAKLIQCKPFALTLTSVCRAHLDRVLFEHTVRLDHELGQPLPSLRIRMQAFVGSVLRRVGCLQAAVQAVARAAASRRPWTIPLHWTPGSNTHSLHGRSSVHISHESRPVCSSEICSAMRCANNT